jgi:hypothetical protein
MRYHDLGGVGVHGKHGYLVLAVLLATCTVTALAVDAAGLLEDMASWGLLDPKVLQEDMSQPVTMDVLHGLARNAFGAWADQQLTAMRTSGGASHLSPAEAVKVFSTVTRAVRGRLGSRAYLTWTGLKFIAESFGAIRDIRGLMGVNGDVTLGQALGATRRLLLVLPCPPAAPDPSEAVREYYRALTDNTGPISSGGMVALLPVCGAAAANIGRNLQVLELSPGGPGGCFALLSLEIRSVSHCGMFAEVVAQRRILTVVDSKRMEDSGEVSFSLRLSPNGWLIFK